MSQSSVPNARHSSIAARVLKQAMAGPATSYKWPGGEWPGRVARATCRQGAERDSSVPWMPALRYVVGRWDERATWLA
eukprot:3036737-Pleurochrysis_carterae.AAC.1